MLVGPWKWTTGGVTTFMNNVANSPLGQKYEILRFNIARPPKRNVTNNYGYGAIWKGGIARLLLGALITLWHVAIFPFVLLMKRPDVVQVQSSDFQVFWECALYVRMARGLRVPVLMRLGGAFDHFYAVSSPRARAMIRRVLLWPDRLIVQSQYWRQAVEILGRTEGIIVLPNSVPDSLVETTRIGDAEPPLCFFAAGSEAVRKGFDEIVEAMRLLRADEQTMRLHIVAASAELDRKLAEAGLAEVVKSEGFLTHAQILETMRRARIFLLPSRAEGFPNALVEAMALGLAPIVTPVGAIPEIVEGSGALVVPVRDARALADAMAQLISDSRLCAKIGAASREAVKSRYIHSAVLPLLATAWQSAITGPGDTPRGRADRDA
ncbi:MAG TPA: glycosyltransferase family 4 protein [Rhizomicrobium sp.]|nr:glycosyltransferase family 4 protein [Rhizomicrobium sp.]